LLAARVEIDVAAGDLLGARGAADELARVAEAFESRALAASAATADGRVRLAAGDRTGARHAFETAVQLWSLVGAPHEAALARTGLAQADSAAGNESDARFELHPPPPVGAQVADGQREPNVFRRDKGDYWSISFEDHTVTLRDLKGLHYLARLLAHPGREFHVLDLVSSGVAPIETPPGTSDPVMTPSGWGDSGVLLDARARNSYRRRLNEIDEDLEDARLMSDLGRVAQAEAERGFLVRELSRAVGLSGHKRRAGSAPERARVSVTRAVRHAMSRIQEHNPALGEHLDRAIRTGTYCAYLPDSRITTTWRT